MNAIDIKMNELRKEYIPYSDKDLYYCYDEYYQKGNIRLLFGMFGGEFFGKYLDNGNSPFYYYDTDYVQYSKDNYDQIVIRDDYSYKIVSIILNRYTNGNKKNNFGLIRLDPFGSEMFDEEQRSFLIKEINLLQPDALIIGFELSTDSNKLFDTKRLKCIFGDEIIFYPLPLPPNMNESHLALIEGIENLNTDVYVLSWDERDFVGDYDGNTVSEQLKYISDNIVKTKRKNN